MRSSKFLRATWLSASTFALAAGGLPSVAAAQTEEQQVDAAEATEDAETQQTTGAPTDDEIVVTGSRIRRGNFDTAQPAVVLGAEQLEARGYTTWATPSMSFRRSAFPATTLSAGRPARLVPDSRSSISSALEISAR